MSFWSWLNGSTPNHEGITPNPNPGTSVGEPDWVPGDPDGLEFDATWDNPIEARGHLSFPAPSPWSGWPAGWSTPTWEQGSRLSRLVDTAWDCIDLNSSVLSTMPVYRTQGGRTVDPVSWMRNPDDTVYNSWQEFAKQLFWDYQMGEAFVLALTYSAAGFPARFRVVPPWLVDVKTRDGVRAYRLGGPEGPLVPEGQMLHIRYTSTTDPGQPRGVGPLESAGAVGRMATIGVLQRYMSTLAETGGRTHEWITSDQPLTKGQVDELQAEYVETKRRALGEPMVFGKGGDLRQAQQMSAKEMALLELSQWNESRIATKFRVPPMVMGLPSGGDSMTYANVTDLFNYHDRAGLRTYRGSVMPALSSWALPAGQAVELNGDEYTRPSLKDRADSYAVLTGGKPIMSADEVRALERLPGPAPVPDMPAPDPAGATSLSGGDQS